MPKLLYLDDMRVPLIVDSALVTSYEEFVAYVDKYGVPEWVSFDHDLAAEAYDDCNANPHGAIDYSKFKEKTGKACAQYLVDNQIPITRWSVHSWNPVGKQNIEAILRAYCRKGEMRVTIPFYIPGSSVREKGNTMPTMAQPE